MAGFQVIIYGRIWVITEAGPVLDCWLSIMDYAHRFLWCWASAQ